MMDGQRTPTRREPTPADLAMTVASARDALQRNDPARALEVLKMVVREFDQLATEAHGAPFRFDRALVAEIMRRPGYHRSDVVATQAALVLGTLGVDTPMENPAVWRPRGIDLDED